jgi:hypothetical protein
LGRFVVLLAGAYLTGGAAALVSTALGDTAGQTSELLQVQADELPGAIGSLDPVAGQQAADDAQACRVPLASVSLATTGPPGTVVRVRSGGYVSPPVRLGRVPQRIAIRFPAPYPAGSGKVQIEGVATDITAALLPQWSLPKLDHIAVRTVYWTPKNAC